ncbi:MAG: polysaccharide biosynthesis/export family protein, partial [Terriglobia bacterium]
MTKRIVSAFALPLLLIVARVPCDEGTTTGALQGQPSAYVLGPSDVITIQALDVDELSNKPVWIDTGGFINLPLVGRMKAAGLTVQELEAELNAQLKPFVKAPHVVVAISEFRSQPVSILGLVTTPGVLQVQGRKTLLEVLSLAGGLRPEAGAVAKITRRLDYGEIPLPGATTDASGQFSVADLQLKALIEGKSPEQNILIRP